MYTVIPDPFSPVNHIAVGPRGRDNDGSLMSREIITLLTIQPLNDRRDNDHRSPYCVWWVFLCLGLHLSPNQQKYSSFLYLWLSEFCGRLFLRCCWTTNSIWAEWMWFDHRYTIYFWWSVILLFFIRPFSTLKRYRHQNPSTFVEE